ncbi:MAG TPA: hypothetical protein VIC62_14520, partial [Nakamurella sp.]
DTLSQIAADHGTDTAAVLAVNLGVPQPGGALLTDPDDIRPGWLIALPPAADNSNAPTDQAADLSAPAADIPPTAAAPTQESTAPSAAPTPAADLGATTSNPVSPALPTAAAPPMRSATPGAGRGDGAVTGAELTQSPQSASSAMAVFAGGGGVLAAVALAALVRHRRRQFRHRLPGHCIASTPDELVDMERAVLTAGSASTADATWLDQALRGVAQQLADDPAGRLPELIAVCMTDTRLQLLLDAPRTEPPGAWTASPDGTRWTLRRADPTGYDPQERGYVLAPFPALVTVGHSTGGEHWLLDLERIGSLTMTGDHDRALALARFLAAELAHNSWAEMLQVTLVGFGAEMADMHPDRLTYAADAAQALTVLASQRRSVAGVIDGAGVDVLQGRLQNNADVWAPHVLLIDPDEEDARAVSDLVTAVKADSDRSTVALVVTTDDETTTAGRWQVRIDAAGVLVIPALGLELIAQQIPAEQAAQMAQLLAFAANTAVHGGVSTPAVVDVAVVDAAVVDAAGPAVEPAWARTGSVLPLPEQAYLEQTATTAQDLQTLAPVVPEQVRAQVEAADNGLDGDLADWQDGTSTRAKVALLGPVTVTPGRGNQAPMSSRTTEIVAYLTTRPHGVSIDEYATDLWPDEPDIIEFTKVKSKVRTSASQVRKLLGVNPRTGVDYLPRNAGALGAAYRLDSDLLVDAVLFRRLRIRGLARGHEGIGDLWAALTLVSGVPFSHRRPGGYGWLAGVGLDHEYTAMIVDLAHTVATHHLAADQPEQAA